MERWTYNMRPLWFLNLNLRVRDTEHILLVALAANHAYMAECRCELLIAIAFVCGNRHNAQYVVHSIHIPFADCEGECLYIYVTNTHINSGIFRFFLQHHLSILFEQFMWAHECFCFVVYAAHAARYINKNAGITWKSPMNIIYVLTKWSGSM